MQIYKILRDTEWAELTANGESPGAPIDIADGFVHFSTAGQVVETLSRHFAGVEGLVMLAVTAETLGPALKWEPSRGGDLFPHLYGPLKLTDVIWSAPVPLAPNGVHILPDRITDA